MRRARRFKVRSHGRGGREYRGNGEDRCTLWCPLRTVLTVSLTSDFSIKLGLGDFVFYSVLVSRAAKYGFAAFAACFLVILGVSRDDRGNVWPSHFVTYPVTRHNALRSYISILQGLGMTLVLLAVFRKALPALPISILLGVFFYLCTRFLITPFIEAAIAIPIYV